MEGPGVYGARGTYADKAETYSANRANQPPQPAELSRVGMCIQTIHTEIKELDDALIELERKIGPVLGPELPQEKECDQVGHPAPDVCRVGAELLGAITQLRKFCLIVRNLTTRTQV